MINNAIIRKFLKDFISNRKNTNRVVVFDHRPFPNVFKYRYYQWDILRIWKPNSFKNILKSSAGMYEHWNTMRTRYFWWIKVCYDLFKGELHSNYIFLHFALIDLEWDSINLFTKINFFSSKTHISTPFAQRWKWWKWLQWKWDTRFKFFEAFWIWTKNKHRRY